MCEAAVYLFIGLISLAIYHFVLAVIFLRLFYCRKERTVADAELPKVAILLPLKGTDPSLQEGISRLIGQNYPNFELRIMVDSREDPAWEVAKCALRESEASNVRLDEFQPEPDVHHLHCGVSKIVQMLAHLNESVKIIAMADGDLIADRDWLRKLVVPMVLHEDIGATFGNRWYMPAEGRWGSLVQYFWNVAAVVPMYLLGIPWGGCLAVRMSAVRRGRLTEKWAGFIAIDASILSSLKQQGLRTKFVPQLMMVNREECDLTFCLNFLQRQLTWTRVYHPHWAMVVTHAILMATILAAPLILMLAGLAMGRWDVAAWSVAGYAAYHAAMLLTTALLEVGVRHVVRARDEETAWLSLPVLVRLPAALALAPWVHLVAVLKATFARFVMWRGSKFEVVGRNTVRNASAPSIPS